MFVVAMIALFAAVAPAQEAMEDLESQEIVFSEEGECLVYEEGEFAEELVLEDEEIALEDTVVFDEE
jgi:hypothetical protein